MIFALKRIFGSANDRILKKLQPVVEEINALEPELEKLSDQQLRQRTSEFKRSIEDGKSLDDLLVPAFATVREAAKRSLGMRPFDVQLMGGMVLHEGKIAEMLTGEGKTLVATLAVYLNALAGKGVHVVTVNDYLASRDAAWMGKLYEFLGLTVGCIIPKMSEEARRAAYAADITYGTNNEFGFDYLRDNMKFRLEDMVQRGFNYAIVDEVDSILVDEARTPLIISGPAESSTDLYVKVNTVIPKLTAEDFELDEKQRNVALTDQGQEHAETLLQEANIIQEGGLYDVQNVSVVHHLNQALRAHKLFVKDRDYIVKDNGVMIIDEFTGRMMEGRRYSDGLHQAIEAKESVAIQTENQTLASVTFQNYFRMYPKLAGMTGTAQTEADEFEEIYNLRVVSVPPNVPVQRADYQDEIYRTEQEKWDAIVTLIKDCRKRKQPVLVGTVTIDSSERLSKVLKKAKIPHQVLNARYHEQEAMIIANAGVPGAVTIATNMAGRGTDIQLGGNLQMRLSDEGLPEEHEEADAKTKKKIETIKKKIAEEKEVALKAGGLYVIGTERHESRRIDNQLRGRSGRQGDPGASKFFLSLDDDLMRIFASERIQSFIGKLGLPEGEPISHPWVTKALEKAQQKVEARNFEIRKQLLKFDDVMNDQRRVIYEQRKEIIGSEDVSGVVNDMRHDVIDHLVEKCIPADTYAENWQADTLHEEAKRLLNLDVPIEDWAKEEGIADQEIKNRLFDLSDKHLLEKEERFTKPAMRVAEKSILLQMLDQNWKDHLLTLDQLRQGITLRAYAQQDPLNEYKREAFGLFEVMLDRLREVVTHLMSHIEPRVMDEEKLFKDRTGPTRESRQDPAMKGNAPADGKPLVTRTAAGTPLQINPADPATWGRVARNSLCPCGSGLKYKHCHGKVS